MREMFDGITPGTVPPGAQLYAAYLDGDWPDFAALLAKYPDAIGVPVAVSASYNGGKVLDVENGDATPAESVNWVLARRRAGVNPTVYCNTSTWPAVRTEFQLRKVAEPHYWLAQYDGAATIPAAWSAAGVVAKQYADKGGYDVSVVADYWPGIDPVPTPPPAPTAPADLPEDDMPYLISVTKDPTMPGEATPSAGIFTVDGGTVVHVDGPSLAALVDRFGPPVVVSPAYYAALLSPEKGGA